MKKTIIIIMLIFVFLLIVIFIFINNLTFTTKAVQAQERYFSYTKALCNDSNFCQDYEIVCRGNEIISQRPITGAVIQHDENWTDPRNNTWLCD